MNILKLTRCLFILPFAWLESIRGKNRDFVTNFQSCRTYSKKVLKSMGLSLHVEGVENLKGLSSVYFVCNHQGTLDPALICASCPFPLHFISKKQNEKIPVLGQWAQNIKTIHFDRETREGNISMLRETLRYLKQKENILIFPEGTRSKQDAMNPFKKNSLKAAYMAKASIVPITINGAYCLDRNDISVKTLSIYYHRPIFYEDYKDISADDLSSQVHEIIESQIIQHERL